MQLSLDMPIRLDLPELAIWFWTTEKTKSAVTVVNDKYSYRVLNKETGRSIFEGSRETLAEAKAQVFKLVM